MTLLKHADRCPRSAYLYLKHGSAPGAELDRGTAFHLWGERVPWLLLEHGEFEREGAAEGETVPVQPVLEAEAAKDLMNAVLDEHPELGVSSQDADALRVMAWHMAGDDRGRSGQLKPDGRPFPRGFEWRPQQVVAVERMFVLEVEGVRVVGKVDIAWLIDMTLRVRDHKTSKSMPDRATYEGSFQGRTYGALMLFGRPLNEATGELEPCLGDGIQWADVGEDFPRYLDQDGRVQERTAVYSRTELQQFVEEDLARVVRRMKGALADGRWPAVRSDAACGECPARLECPLPSVLRQHAGEINTLAEAEEALTWAEVQAAQVAATRREVRVFARAHQVAVPCGNGEVYDFVPEQKWLTDWQALESGVDEARMFGRPFALSEVRRRQDSTPFKKVKT